MTAPRVAFFTDSFHEVNGVALTSRQFVGFARKKRLPIFSVHAGPETRFEEEDATATFELQTSALRLELEHDLAFDLWFMRHRDRVEQALRQFRPDLVHVTGPGHCGMLGAILAYSLKVPLVASWHTNVHEFGARRLQKLLSNMPAQLRQRAVSFSQRKSLDLTLRFYELARLHFSPNHELVDLLRTRTGKPGYLMERGVDTWLFSPARRERSGRTLVVGYVGRLSPEKNVRFLAAIEKGLIAAGHRDYRFLVLGEGSERNWLRANLRQAELPGILQGEPLAKAYASMDIFAFPSMTDTFGNVVLEAMASGVPAVVTADGGPKFLVRSGVTGFVAANEAAFVRSVLELAGDSELSASMRRAAREYACGRSWDAVFESVYEHYEECFRPAGVLVA